MRSRQRKELCMDRETELYKLKRDCSELKEMLAVIEINDTKYLLCRVEIEICFEYTCLKNNNVDNYIECSPVLRRGVLVVNDFEIERLKSVSYPHLDVYKRQAHHQIGNI